MRVTKIDLVKDTLPDNLERTLEAAKTWIDNGLEGILTRAQMAEALELSEFLPDDLMPPKIIAFQDRNDAELPGDEPAFYQLAPKRQRAQMSACGPKMFEQYTVTEFTSPSKGSTVSKAATIAYLWLINATFHGHGNEEGNINKGWTFEDYEVHPGGGSGWYIMGSSVYYVEPDKEPEKGTAGWTIPPGKLHGVLSEDSENPALAVLRFQRQGLGTRKMTKNPKGWGFPRDEKVYGYASDAIRSMHEIAQGRKETIKLPDSFIFHIRQDYILHPEAAK